MKNYCDGGEAILEAFRKAGVDYIISSPGSECASVWEALARQKMNKADGPTYIDCWHEMVAVDMAIGYTHVTGRPQAVLFHTGEGILQAATAIRAAQLAEVPLVVMSGEALSYGENPELDPGPQWYRSLSVVGGPQRLVEPITKWSSQVTSPYTIYESVIRATEMAQRIPQGPVYLNVPVESMLHEWTPPENRRKVPAAPKTRAHQDDIAKIVPLLVAASNPVILTDHAGRDPHAFGALVELAELLSIPVVEGRGCHYANFPKNHPLHQGTNFDPFLDKTDLVLVVGSSAPWYPPSNRPKNGSVIVIDENPIKNQMVYQSLQADVYLEGDIATSLKLIADAVRALGIAADKYTSRHAKWASEHQKIHDDLRAAELKERESQPIGPRWLCAVLRELVPSDAIYVDETISHSPLVQQHLSWDKPQSYFHIHGGLGQGIGMALGVKLAAPTQPVVLLVGDGSFLYNPIVQALGASKASKLPVLIIVFNNGKYQAMQNNVLRFYPDGASVTENIYHGVHINGPDYAELGKPFGFHGQRVENPAELESAVKDALAAVKNGNTAILNVVLR